MYLTLIEKSIQFIPISNQLSTVSDSIVLYKIEH